MVSLTRSLLRNWSPTLNLPKSTFPARATTQQLSAYRRQCSDGLYYEQFSGASKPLDDAFLLHDGPPYANGRLHIGHAVNKILKDIICRIQLQNGRLVHYQPGWDCHGLPIELKALEAWKKSEEYTEGAEKSPIAIRDAARKLAQEAALEQKNGFKEWGVMGDFQHPWYTMDPGYVVDQLRVFLEMVKKNLIMRRFKPVYWSASSRTALAEAELEYMDDHVSTAAYVKLPLSKHQLKFMKGVNIHNFENGSIEDVSLVVWTTTPWTLPANKAIAVSKDLTYLVINDPKLGTLVVAESRLPALIEALKIDSPKQLAKISGAHLAKTTSYWDICGDRGTHLPILTADFVTPDSGTGIVHCAPGHGMDDYELCRKLGIEAFAPVDDEGKFTDQAWPSNGADLTGKSVLGEGNDAVIAFLHSKGQILRTHEYTHKYPYDWRSKTPVIVRATEQWFANLGPIRDQALAALDQVKFIPASGRGRLESFVNNRSEWCISRQRAWGVPIPALYHKDTGEALLNNWTVMHIMEEIEKSGIEAWFTDPPDDPKWTPLGLRKSKNITDFRRGTDTMDVWFDSGTSWMQASRAIKSLGINRDDRPLADVYIEGTDQHRGWFQSSLLTHIAYQDPTAKPFPRPPFKTLITHGFTLDASGRKMSKSLGNVVEPDEIISGAIMPYQQRKKGAARPDPLGPDALRLFVASSDYTKDMSISPDSLKAVYSNLTRFRTTFKLLLGALKDFVPNPTILEPANYPNLPASDRIALHQISELQKTVNSAFNNFEFHKGVTAIAKWVNLDFSAQYIESVKDRLYCESPNSFSRLAAQETLCQIYRALSSMLAPLLPLLVQESIHHAPESLKPTEARDPFKFPNTLPAHFLDPDLKRDLALLLAAKAAISTAQESARREQQLRSGLECAVCLEVPNAKYRELFKKYLDDGTLENLFVVSDVRLQADSAGPSEIVKSPWSHQVEFGSSDKDEETCRVWIYPPLGKKCERCWRYKVYESTTEMETNTPDQEPLADEPAHTEGMGEHLCERCEGAVNGKREE
jgi:isoleucyl-tRNA synthetase